MEKDAGVMVNTSSDAVEAMEASGKYGAGQTKDITSTRHLKKQWKPVSECTGSAALMRQPLTGETKMTREQAIEILTAEEAAAAIAEGTSWGVQEAELWRDQHDAQLPAWTLGTYAGKLPFPNDATKRDAYELLIDLAAQDAWNNS